jgi:hypothetical protein
VPNKPIPPSATNTIILGFMESSANGLSVKHLDLRWRSSEAFRQFIKYPTGDEKCQFFT